MNSPSAHNAFSSATALVSAVNDAAHNAALTNGLSQGDLASLNTSRSLAFVDAGIDHLDSLIEGLQNAQIVLIDSQQDGVAQMTAALAEQQNLDSIHVFSHGASGVLQLGDSVLSSGSLGLYGEQLQQWRQSLSADADLLFYGCNLGAGEAGSAFTRQVSELTGADVAASNNLSGIGGDWQLEVATGEIESAIALSETTQANYQGTLATTLDNGDFESGLAGWSPYTGSESVSNATSFSGDQSLQLSAAGSGAQQFLEASGGGTYTVTGYAKTSSNGSNGVGINFFDADYNFLKGASDQISSSEWQAYRLEGEAPAGSRYMQVWAYKDAENGDFFIDSVTLSADGAGENLPIDSVEAGAELLSNSGFESGLGRWNQWTGTEQVSNSESVGGGRSLQLAAAASGVNQFVDATAGEDYTLSVSAKTSSDRYAGVGFQFFDANYTALAGGMDARITSADWDEYGGSAIAPEGTRYAQVWAYKHGENGTVFIDDFSLSVGEAPPQSTPPQPTPPQPTPPQPTDTTAPSATLNAIDISIAGNETYDFTVTYRDDTAVDNSTFNSRDIRVNGPNGFTQLATFAATDSNQPGTPRTATYRLNAPGGLWDGDDNGLYSVFLEANQVSDTAGNASDISVSLGDFTVGLRSDTLPLGPLNSGVAVSDDATGTGYLMHSQELVPVRFLSDGPAAGNAGNLIAVQYRADQWYYDNDTRQVAFTPRSSDRLLAELDFSVDSATLLAGTRSVINGIDAGYESGDLSITPNHYAEQDDVGEFEVLGREVLLYGQGGLVPGQLSFRESSITIDEDAGTANLIVERLGGSDGAVAASYMTTSVSAFEAEDYETSAGVLAFKEGEIEKTISVAILDDTKGETDEVFSISLSEIQGGASIGRGSAAITIGENDGGVETSGFNELLPDLVPIVSTSGDYSIDTNEIPGQVLLRLSTEVANAGDGPLELWGVDTTAATQSVFQRIYNDEGGDRDQLAGEFVNYTSHGHFHFEGFATYNLREKNADDSVGAVIASGGKTSFCLININQPFPELTESAIVADGRGGDDCDFIQGIDVGYADVYGKRLPNQWVDVTSVPDGDYWLEITTDPDNNILESDESNNTAYLEVSLDNPQ